MILYAVDEGLPMSQEFQPGHALLCVQPQPPEPYGLFLKMVTLIDQLVLAFDVPLPFAHLLDSNGANPDRAVLRFA